MISFAPHRFATLLALACLTLAACGSAPQRTSDVSLPTSRDPDQLVALALQAWAAERNLPRALQLAEAAAQAAPSRADLAWVQLRLCLQSPRCEAPAPEARLKKLAPDNGAVWLSVLARVQAQRDAQAEEQIVTAMAAAASFNFYWNTLLARTTTAWRANGPARRGAEAAAPLTAALNDVTGWLSSLMLPAFKSLNTACSAERIAALASRRMSCEQIAQALQKSDSYAAEGLGLSIARRTAPGQTSAAHVEERIALLAYQNRTAGSVMAAQLEKDKFAQEFIELLERLPREQDVSRAVLRWAGEPLRPGG